MSDIASTTIAALSDALPQAEAGALPVPDERTAGRLVAQVRRQLAASRLPLAHGPAQSALRLLEL